VPVPDDIKIESYRDDVLEWSGESAVDEDVLYKFFFFVVEVEGVGADPSFFLEDFPSINLVFKCELDEKFYIER